MPLIGYTAQWQDQTATGVLNTTFWEQAEDTVVADAIAACSRAKLVSLQATVIVGGASAGGPGDTPVQVSARLLFTDENGNRVPLLIPGADPAIFLADGETVNPGNAAVAALITAVLAHGASGAGTTIVAYTSGAKVVVPTPAITH